MPQSADKAYLRIRTMILDGEYLPGDHLSEQSLSVAVGVSRTPIRDALRRLEAEYFVTIQPHLGARVRSWSADDIEDLFKLRAMIEGFAARRAAQRAKSMEIKNLRSEVARIDQVLLNHDEIDFETFLDANGQFHRILCEATGNCRLVDLIDSLVAQAVVVRTARTFSIDDLRTSNLHHKSLVNAIEERDADLAESIMRMHILAAGRSYAKIYGNDADARSDVVDHIPN